MKHFPLRRADILLLLALLLIGGVLALALLLTGRGGQTVQVRVAGEVVASYPLSENRTCTVEGVSGGTNELVIQDGEAWLTDASCPDQLCVNMGKIDKAGQSIVCLPNQVVIEIVGDRTESEDDVDLIVG